MPTITNPRKSKPPTKGQPSRGFSRPRATAQPTRRRPGFSRTSAKPAAKGPSGFIGRAQATLPGRKPPAKKSAVEGVLSALGSAKSTAAARKPSKKGIVGILAGGLGLAAVAKRRRGEKPDEMPMTQPVSPVADPDAPAAGPTPVPSEI
jgi:hypothetical protein